MGEVIGTVARFHLKFSTLFKVGSEALLPPVKSRDGQYVLGD